MPRAVVGGRRKYRVLEGRQLRLFGAGAGEAVKPVLPGPQIWLKNFSGVGRNVDIDTRFSTGLKMVAAIDWRALPRILDNSASFRCPPRPVNSIGNDYHNNDRYSEAGQPLRSEPSALMGW
jgi:hypothetical protein